MPQNTPIPQALATEGKPAPETKKPERKAQPSFLRELTDRQLEACEFASDLIMSGGRRTKPKSVQVRNPPSGIRNWLVTGPRRRGPRRRDGGPQQCPKWPAKLNATTLERVMVDFMADASIAAGYLIRGVIGSASQGSDFASGFAFELSADETRMMESRILFQ